MRRERERERAHGGDRERETGRESGGGRRRERITHSGDKKQANLLSHRAPLACHSPLHLVPSLSCVRAQAGDAARLVISFPVELAFPSCSRGAGGSVVIEMPALRSICQPFVIERTDRYQPPTLAHLHVGRRCTAWFLLSLHPLPCFLLLPWTGKAK